MLRKDKLNVIYEVSEGSYDPSDTIVISVDFRATTDFFTTDVVNAFKDTRTSPDVMINNEDNEGQCNGTE